ncbi:MAG TPA: iron-containing alcohol dehydrogenase [Solirubrobacterales bacterium]|nr:iron-containing alcohol dehydrogenase [Solirubrobacterales bacterium]
MSAGFVWRDAGRVVVFRSGGLGEAPQLLREHGFDEFELLTTPRALIGAPELESAARAVHAVAAGQVPELAAELLQRVERPQLVALGGGRVIDTAKAVASVSGAHVAAVPTTLSGAEMTAIHRLPAGAEERVREMVRPQLAIADPEAMTGQEEGQLRASAMNALAHGADSLYTPFSNPVSRMAALRGAQLIGAALDRERSERDRAALAQGAILCGYAIDSGAFALHHVICQTLVRVCGSPHAETNAAVLPHTMDFMATRAPEEIGALCESLETDPADLGARIRELGGDPPGLGAVGADRSALDRALDSMLARPELAFGPEPPAPEQLRDLVEAAW